ncbi:MAG TPA: low molecular weight protein-tyrosine-phosphatase [Bacillaceae bacterium]
MVKVLFVCLGNICRSPMAEALFRDMVKREGLNSKIEVDSAGTGSWHIGSPPHKGTLKILDKYQIASEGLVARSFKKEDAEDFDYIIGMDESNLVNMRDILGKPDHPKILRLLDLTDQKKDVPDPYLTGDFEETYELVTAGCRALLEIIKNECSLN